MVYDRLPRFKRVPATGKLTLTSRDRAIIALVHRHRFLRSSQILEFLGGSAHLLRRLQLLYHQGYLERPRAQLDYYHKGGSRFIVYGLGSKGAALLRAEKGGSFKQLRWSEKNRAVGRIFLEHALMISDITATLEFTARKASHIRVIPVDELVKADKSPSPSQWNIKMKNQTIRVVPDRIFALEFTKPDGKPDSILLFLEADRGTMPVERTRFNQSSIYRKLLAYEATWTQKIHETHFNHRRVRVLIVTTSAKRHDAIRQACAKLTRGHGLFLFTDVKALTESGDLFGMEIPTGRLGVTSSLIG